MWSDNETTQDLLGYQVHADLLKKIILNDAMLPISIGVFGNWGSGKSSLMLLLQQSLIRSALSSSSKMLARTNCFKTDEILSSFPTSVILA